MMFGEVLKDSTIDAVTGVDVVALMLTPRRGRREGTVESSKLSRRSFLAWRERRDLRNRRSWMMLMAKRPLGKK